MRLDRRAESTSGGQRFDAGRWSAAGSVLTAVPGYGDIYSEARFGAHRLHLDFQLPREPEWVPGTLRGTGGVFVAGVTSWSCAGRRRSRHPSTGAER